MRVIPELGQFLSFYDFNLIQTRPRDFAVAMLNTVDIDKRAKMVVRLSQTKEKGDFRYEALEESLVFTLSREI